MNNDPSKLIDSAIDVWERVTSDQTTRTGDSAARVASALANDVAPEVVALQMTLNSKKHNPDSPVEFSENDMFVIAKFYAANQTYSAFTKSQAGFLIREQRVVEASGEPSPNV